MNGKEIIGGLVGTGLGVIGTATQTQEILQIVSLIITILGGIISLIVIPILNWYKNAKKDGKITIDEAIDGAKTINDGINALEDKLKGDEKDADKRDNDNH